MAGLEARGAPAMRPTPRSAGISAQRLCPRGPARDAVRVHELAERIGGAETAVFRGDDPDCLVAAGLACRTCLSADVEWSLRLEPWDHRVLCRCRECGHERTISLDPDQALRLSLHEQRAPASSGTAPRVALGA